MSKVVEKYIEENYDLTGKRLRIADVRNNCWRVNIWGDVNPDPEDLSIVGVRIVDSYFIRVKDDKVVYCNPPIKEK